MVTWSDAEDLLRRRIGDIRVGQTIESYISYIERRLSRPDFTLEVLEVACRHYGVGIDQLSFVLAARRAGMDLESVIDRVRAITTKADVGDDCEA